MSVRNLVEKLFSIAMMQRSVGKGLTNEAANLLVKKKN